MINSSQKQLLEEQSSNLTQVQNLSLPTLQQKGIQNNHNQSFFKLNKDDLSIQVKLKLGNQQKHILKLSAMIIALMIVVTTSLYYKQYMTNLLTYFHIVDFQKHIINNHQLELSRTTKVAKVFQSSINEPFQASSILKSMYEFCPRQNSTFHLYFNEGDVEMKGLTEAHKLRAYRCKVPILTYKDLHVLKRKWNIQHPDNKINVQNLSSPKFRHFMLVLLQLYFYAGTYTDINIPYFMIQNRCWKYLITGFQIVWGDSNQTTQSGTHLPKWETFLKVNYPYSEEIREIILKLSRKQDHLQKCRNKQCLIMKCIVK